MRSLLPILLVAVTGCSRNEPATKPPIVETVSIGSVQSAAKGSQLTGTIHATIETDLGFRVPGIVVSRLVDRGAHVSRGQVIARIDAADFRSSAASAAATAAAAERDAQAAAATAETAAIEERRLRGLDTAGAVAPLTYERARNQARTTAEQARAARSRVGAARADAKLAGDQTSYTLLRAPLSGVISDVFIEPGQVVQAGTAVVRLAGDGNREAEVFLPEAMLQAARGPASASLYNGGGAGSARLREVSAAADPTTRTYRARYVLSGVAADAPLGSTVTITMQGGAGTGLAGIRLPIGAIVKRGGPPLVYVVDRQSGRAMARRVQIIEMGSETVVVSGQLRPGDRAVSLGGFLLKPGQKVRLAPPSTVTGS